ncbi:HDOD domain-containing protein [Motiliproteus sp. MSK22-1]|uniref:HDOD domain-containing protein n=1 Tax=Motiliproteus sp. MSK22-1 TaxID=1897630 RepID=UPI000975A058|nr:HDOD domain-containing protein [Motiliproteus sp. MSK22-1]OMH29513.1 hypothetical protein BGP75_19930 [Motiliproteus sp. MSK22-1]
MTPEELTNGIDQLVSLPDAVIRANELLESDQAGADEIGEVIGHDPALSAKLLRLVNSAFYSFPSQIDTVSRAITLIGINELRSLIFASSATQVFNDIAPELVDMNTFWHRSVYCGLVAKKFSTLCGKGKGEAQFLTGLLHDIGHLILYIRAPDKAQTILEETSKSKRALFEVEQQMLGFNSADIGAALLENWRLPKSLWIPVKHQHFPDKATEYKEETAILNLSLSLTDCLEPEIKTSEALDIEKLPPAQLNDTNLTSEELGLIAMDANIESFEVLSIINPLATTLY